METTTSSSYVQGVNLDQTSYEDITEGPSENPANDITMLSVMSTASNDPEIRDESLMSLGTEISMRSLHDRSMLSIGSESSTDTQVAVQAIYKNLQKLKKKLLKRKEEL